MYSTPMFGHDSEKCTSWSRASSTAVWAERGSAVVKAASAAAASLIVIDVICSHASEPQDAKASCHMASCCSECRVAANGTNAP